MNPSCRLKYVVEFSQIESQICTPFLLKGKQWERVVGEFRHNTLLWALTESLS